MFKKRSYHDMDTDELIALARKNNLDGYDMVSEDPDFKTQTVMGVSREAIIRQLVAKDDYERAGVTQIAMWVTVMLTLISVGAAVINVVVLMGKDYIEERHDPNLNHVHDDE